MKKTHKIISILLVLAMLLSVAPLTAFAATEAFVLEKNYIDYEINYSDKVTQYYQDGNYLYKVTYTNLKNVKKVNVSSASGQLRLNFEALDTGNSYYSKLYKAKKDLAYTGDLPKSPGSTLSCLITSEDRASNINKPVVIFTCIAVNAPAWTWDGTSSATAKFTSTDGNAFVNMTATISQETVTEATTCQMKEQIKYTASVTFNGQTYTNTKTVTGAAGPHSYINGKCEHCGYECPHNSFTDGKCNVCGVQHTHDYIYTANGNVITATCSNADGVCSDTNGGTLTISAPAELYADGVTAKEAVIDNQLVEAADYTVTYSTADGNAPKTAGTYTASVTVGGATASVEFTLSNYDAKVTDEDGNLIGNYKTFADAVTAAQEIEYSTLTLLDDITVTTLQVIYSGNFTIDLNGKTLLNETKQTIRLQSDADVTIKDSGEGGTIQTNGETAQAIYSYGTLTVESGIIKGGGGIFNRGTLNFKNGRAESHNYYAIDNLGTAYIYNGTFKAVSSAAIGNSPDSTVYVYGGEFSGSVGIVNHGTAYIEGGEFTGNSNVALNLLGGTVEVTGGSFTGTDDEYGSFSGTPYGEYTVYYGGNVTLTLKGGEFPNGFTVYGTTANTFLADGYHFRNEQGKIVDGSSKIIEGKVTVEKGADFSADAVVTAEDVVYNGSAQEPDVTVTIGGKTLTEGKDYTLTFANNINAGTATVTVTSAGDYEGKIVKTFEIAKADSSIVVYPEADELTYNGEAQTLIIIGDSNDGSIVYSLDGEKYSLLPPTGTNAGEYTVYYKVIGDANHNDTEPETVIATIEKKSVTASATVADKIYDGTTTVDASTVSIIFDGIVDGDDVKAESVIAMFKNANAGNNKAVIVAYKAVGEDVDNYEVYIDYVTVPENEFYYIETKANILPKDISNAVITLGDALTYNGAEQTQSIAGVTVDGLDVTYTVSGNTAKNVGVYQLTVTGTGNFTGEATALYEIAVDMNGVDFDQLHPLNVKATDKEKIEYIYNQLDNASREYADAEKRNEWDNNKSYCVELLKMIESVANHIESFENDLAKYDINTVTSDDAADLESLEESIGYFYNYYFDNLTEEQEKKTSDIFWAVVKLEIRISDVAKEYERIIEEVNKYSLESITSADKDALVQLNEDIYALALTENVTAEEKEKLQAAHDKVFALIDKLVGISDEIKRITEKVDAYVFESVKSSDKADIQQLVADIKTLLDTQNLTADERALLETADETCDKLIAKIDETIAEIKRINNATNAYDEATVTSADKEAVEQLIEDIKALTDGDNITDAEREQLNGNDETLEALLAIIKAVADEIEKIEDAVNSYDEKSVKSSDKEALDQLKADIKALTDTNNITEDERAKLGELDATLDSLIKKIDDTAAEIARIDEAVNSYDKETVTSVDVPALGKLIDDIKALTDGGNLTDDEKAALEENNAAIDGLVEKLTEVAEEIKRVDEAVKSYDEETVKSSDSDELAQLKEDIQALIDSTNTTENEKTAFGEMLEKVNALLDKITETEEKLEEIKEIENNFNPENVSSDDKAAIEEKIAEIEAVNPDNLTNEQKAEYDEIKAGFEALLEEIEKAGSEVDTIGAELEMFNEERVTIFYEDEIEALKAKIDELLADENMGEAEKAKLNEYKAQCDNLIEIINTPAKYFSMRLFHFVWDALHWLSSHVVFIFNWIVAMF